MQLHRRPGAILYRDDFRCWPQVLGAQPDMIRHLAHSLAIAMCEVGSLAERRIAVLTDLKMSGLPPFLIEDSGVQFGLHDRPRHRRGAGLGE